MQPDKPSATGHLNPVLRIGDLLQRACQRSWPLPANMSRGAGAAAENLVVFRMQWRNCIALVADWALEHGYCETLHHDVNQLKGVSC